MKIFKHKTFTLILIALLSHNAWATIADVNFSASKVTEKVYSIIAPSYGRPTPENKGWNSNSHFVITDNGVLVFDTGSSETIGKEIIKTIESVTNQPIRWVVNSHSHADHWLGNAAFAEMGAEIISTESSIEIMRKNGQVDVNAFFRMTKGETGVTRLSYPTSLISGGERRNLGGVTVEFFLTNDGHSPGDVLMWLPQQKIIFGGDITSAEWVPIMTPRGNVPQLVNVLNMLKKMKPEFVLTGHGKTTTVESLVRDSEFLEAAWTLVKEGYSEDKTLDLIVPHVLATLNDKYRPLYRDFDASMSYLVEMMYNKQM